MTRDNTFKECPVCARRICDHTIEERGADFFVAVPRLPTIGWLLEQQGDRCATCQGALPSVYNTIVLHGQIICPACYHRVSIVDRLAEVVEVGRTSTGGPMVELTGNALAQIKTPNLPNDQRAQLLEALADFAKGRRVELAVRYKRVGDRDPSVPGEDYRPRLAHGPDVLEGEVKDIAKGRNGWYILIDASLTRQPITEDHGTIGWRSIKGEGMIELLGVRSEGEALPPAQ